MNAIVSRILITKKGDVSSSPVAKLAQVNVVAALLLLLLLLLSSATTSTTAHAAATGDPIDFATIGDTTDSHQREFWYELLLRRQQQPP